jgi:hypothetical protein
MIKRQVDEDDDDDVRHEALQLPDISGPSPPCPRLTSWILQRHIMTELRQH